ncbi:GIY-YIG nuclease family protein [Fervidibacter sacchari]
MISVVPFPLNSQYVSQVPSKCGVYLLLRQNRGWRVLYVGRSNDLNRRLQEHLPNNEVNPCLRRNRPTHFAYWVTRDEKEAYEAECWLYHDYSPLCNDSHPAKPSGRLQCPVCGQ